MGCAASSSGSSTPQNSRKKQQQLEDNRQGTSNTTTNGHQNTSQNSNSNNSTNTNSNTKGNTAEEQNDTANTPASEEPYDEARTNGTIREVKVEGNHEKQQQEDGESSPLQIVKTDSSGVGAGGSPLQSSLKKGGLKKTVGVTNTTASPSQSPPSVSFGGDSASNNSTSLGTGREERKAVSFNSAFPSGGADGGGEDGEEYNRAHSPPFGGGGGDDHHLNGEHHNAGYQRSRSKSIAVLEEISRERQKSVFAVDTLDTGRSSNGQEERLKDFSFGNPLTSSKDGGGGRSQSLGTSPSSNNLEVPGSGSDSRGDPFASSGNARSPLGNSGGPFGGGSSNSSSDLGGGSVRVAMGTSSRRRSSFAPPNTRQRRLSSVFNEFASQVDQFLSREKNMSPSTTSTGSSSLQSPDANTGGSNPLSIDGSNNNQSNASSLQQQQDSSAGSNNNNNSFADVDDRPDTGRSSGGGSAGGGAAEDDLRRIYDAFESKEGEGVTESDLESGFMRMGYTSSSPKQLKVMFRAADKKKAGVLQWPEFKAFFRHLADMSSDDLGEEEDQTEEVRTFDRHRAMSFAACPIQFKSYKLEPLGSLPSRVKALALSPHRPVYAASDRHDTQAHLFDLQTGERVRSLVGHKDSLLSIALSPDRKYVATCSRDGFLTLWDSTIGCELGAVQHPGIVTCCAFTSDGKGLITGCQDNMVRRFKCHRAQLERTMMPLPQTELGVIVAVATQKHAKEKILFSRSNDKGAYLLDYSTFRVIGELSGHTALVWQVDFSHNGVHCLTVCEKELRIWNVMTMQCMHVIQSSEPSPLSTLKPLPVNPDRPKLWTTAQFSPPQFGSVVVACCTDTNLFIYDASTSKMIWNEVSKSTVYVVSSGVDEPCVLMGDDLGNIMKLSLVIASDDQDPGALREQKKKMAQTSSSSKKSKKGAS